MPARPQRSAHALGSPRAEPGRARRLRVTLPDRARTLVHVAQHDVASTEVRVHLLRRAEPLETWCAERGIDEAIVGGFFTRPDGRPLGELRTRGIARSSVAFDAPWDAERSCVHAIAGRAQIARRDELPASPRGDLLQAGPLLVRDGEALLEADPEGFSSGARQFDADITVGRYPRAALALAGDRLLAVACDGRSRHDAGLTLTELADVLVGLGAETAINLDGGGSTSLVCGGRLRNNPRDADAGGRPSSIPGGRPITTAIAFTPRG